MERLGRTALAEVRSTVSANRVASLARTRLQSLRYIPSLQGYLSATGIGSVTDVVGVIWFSTALLIICIFTVTQVNGWAADDAAATTTAPPASPRFGPTGRSAGPVARSDATVAPLWHLLLSAVAIVAIWLIAASRWIVTDRVVPWDSKNQFYAFFRFLAASLHSGASPFWNPYHYGGHPSVADPQSLIFAPAFFLWALFDPAPSLRTFDLIVYAHLLLGGLAMAAIGWRARWPAAAFVLAAVVFMFAGVAEGKAPRAGAGGRLLPTGGHLRQLFPRAV